MTDQRNLLQETLAMLNENGKTPEAVRWVGALDGSIVGTWAEFAALADRDYDAGFGTNEVDLSLAVVGDDWWLMRSEYDGSEEWLFMELPRRQLNAQPLTRVFED